MKTFVAVQFYDKSHEVIPSTWIFEDEDDKKLCKLPPSDIKELSSSRSDIEKKWKTYSIKKILAEANSYERCEKKLYTPGGYKSTTTDNEVVVKTTVPEPSSAPIFHLKKLKNDVNNKSTPTKSTSDPEVKDRLRRIEKQLLKQSEIYEALNEKIEKLIKPQEKKINVPNPANSIEELDELAVHPSIVQELQSCCAISMAFSCRKIVKRLMSPDLMKTFSYSGLGNKRKRTKRSLKAHKIMYSIIDALVKQGYTNHSEITMNLQKAMRHLNEPHSQQTNEVTINSVEEAKAIE